MEIYPSIKHSILDWKMTQFMANYFCIFKCDTRKKNANRIKHTYRSKQSRTEHIEKDRQRERMRKKLWFRWLQWNGHIATWLYMKYIYDSMKQRSAHLFCSFSVRSFVCRSGVYFINLINIPFLYRIFLFTFCSITHFSQQTLNWNCIKITSKETTVLCVEHPFIGYSISRSLSHFSLFECV